MMVHYKQEGGPGSQKNEQEWNNTSSLLSVSCPCANEFSAIFFKHLAQSSSNPFRSFESLDEL